MYHHLGFHIIHNLSTMDKPNMLAQGQDTFREAFSAHLHSMPSPTYFEIPVDDVFGVGVGDEVQKGFHLVGSVLFTEMPLCVCVCVGHEHASRC